MQPKIKNIIIFVAIFALLVVGYVLFFGNKAETPALTSTAGISGSSTATTVTGTSDVGKEFLATLLNLRTIKLDDSIFSDPAFRSLQDFELALIPEANPGRLNPFLPLGSDIRTTAAIPTVSTVTGPTTPTTTGTVQAAGTPSAGFPTSTTTAQ
ncbi:MAG: hypothetical protein MUD00_03375 [Candidatus Pacebacteria bacterium]|jgi:hypothetical protein|nr:hypothetical protein [Candidatus Paceibacterota bacterium]